jgi:AAA15 family ATPase/GTPase
VLVTVSFSRGVVLVDEIENGIFHDQHQLLWRTLSDLARKHDTQLFVSTHSKESLKESAPVIKDTPSDFSLIRVRREKGQSSIEVFGGEQMEAAIEKNGEVRD